MEIQKLQITLLIFKNGFITSLDSWEGLGSHKLQKIPLTEKLKIIIVVNNYSSLPGFENNFIYLKPFTIKELTESGHHMTMSSANLTEVT